MYKLQLFDGADPTQLIDARLFAEGSMTIGRDPRANWSIDDPECALSRWHCELFARTDGLVMRSTGANGVFFDTSGERLPDDAETLLPLPCSLELGNFRLVASMAPFGDENVNANTTLVLTPPVGTSAEVPSDWPDSVDLPEMTGGSLLEAFCQGAGIDSSRLSEEDPGEIMRRAGAIYRQMVLGIGDLMTERDRARGQYEMRRTTIGGKGNNPFKWAPSQRLALDLLLSGPASFLSGPAAVQSSFRDIKRHLVASFAGLQGCLQAAVQTFDPAELDRAVPDKKASLLKSRASVQMDEVRRRHADLVTQLEQGREGTLDAAFVRAYDRSDSANRAAS
jgi:predicted component of type VI protein secretion system